MIQGSGVALVTPFKADGSVDLKSLEKLVNHVTKGGIEFLVALGTTAESATLTKEEKKDVLDCIKSSNSGNLPVVIGAGGNNTSEVVRQLEALDSSAYDAILSVAPYYNKPTQNGLIAHFKAVIDVSPVPVVLYNVPGRTSSNIDADTCIHLAEYSEKVIAVKEASGNMEQIMEIINRAPDHFSILSGDDNLTLSMIAMGAKGVVSVSGQLIPDTFSAMVTAAMNDEMGIARANHYKLFDLTRLLYVEGNPAGVKSGLQHIGICGAQVRLPLVKASQSLNSQISMAIEKLN